MIGDWSLLGEVVRTQIHRAEVVHDGIYDAPQIARTDSLWITPSGVVGVVGGRAELDSHHRDHPRLGRFRPGRQLSVGFTGHYRLMAERFGDVAAGIAAENVLVAHDGRVAESDLGGGLMVETPAGRYELAAAKIARPCVPFTRFLLGSGEPDDQVVSEHRAFLQDGMRGYVLALVDLEVRFQLGEGDRVYARPSDQVGSADPHENTR